MVPKDISAVKYIFRFSSQETFIPDTYLSVFMELKKAVQPPHNLLQEACDNQFLNNFWCTHSTSNFLGPMRW